MFTYYHFPFHEKIISLMFIPSDLEANLSNERE